VRTATVPSTTFVESQLPPRPTSTTATSTGASAKAANAMTVRTSKKLRGGPPSASDSRSATPMYGATSSQIATKRSSSTGSPSIWMRSVTLDRWGLVNSPVRRPCSRTSDSTMRAVEDLPLVPVTCTDRNVRWGSPSSSMTRSTRAMVGSILCSGIREKISRLTVLKASLT
jgi:hypothetical protein